MANSDRLSQLDHRISLFLQTLVLRGIFSREQAHCQELMRGINRRAEICIRRYERHDSFSDIEEFYLKTILVQ